MLNKQKRLNKIIVLYKGKEYIRDSGIINVTLFENKPSKVKIGVCVELLDIDDGTIMNVYICETQTQVRYKRSGGAYYGNSLEIEKTGTNIGEIMENGAFSVSEYSPVGKSVLGKSTGDLIVYETPERIIKKCRIIDVYEL